MKKIITILWIIIIAGTIFIAINFFKPDTKPETTPTDSSTIIENTIIIEEEIKNLDDDEAETFSNYLSTGDEYFFDNAYEKAAENYKKASELNPQSSEALRKLGKAQLKNNEPEKAKETLLLASNLNPNSQEIKLTLAKAYLNTRSVDEAKNIIWNLDQNNLEVKYYKAITLILYKQFEEAKNLFNEIVTSQSIPDASLVENANKFLTDFVTFSYYTEAEQVFLELLLAKTLTDVGEFDAAIPLLYEILNQKNNYRDAWIVLGYAYLNTNKITDAIDALLQAKALTPDKPETLFFLGLAYFANNDIDKAIYYIEAADKADYESEDQINLKLGDLYILKENYKQAAKKYDEVITSNPENLDLYARAIWLNIEKTNTPDRALALALQLLEYHPDNEMSLNLAGWAYTATGDFDKGKDYLTQALEINPNFDAANLNFGWLYEKQGLNDLAKEYYKKAYVLGNGNAIGNLAAIRFNNLEEKEISDSL